MLSITLSLVASGRVEGEGSKNGYVLWELRIDLVDWKEGKEREKKHYCPVVE